MTGRVCGSVLETYILKKMRYSQHGPGYLQISTDKPALNYLADCCTVFGHLVAGTSIPKITFLCTGQ